MYEFAVAKNIDFFFLKKWIISFRKLNIGGHKIKRGKKIGRVKMISDALLH